MDITPATSTAVLATPAYRALVRRRRRLTWTLTATLFVLLMTLTALTVFTSALDGEIVPGLNGAVLAAYVLFFAPVAFAHIYVSRVNILDELADKAVAQAGEASGAGR